MLFLCYGIEESEIEEEEEKYLELMGEPTTIKKAHVIALIKQWLEERPYDLFLPETEKEIRKLFQLIKKEHERSALALHNLFEKMKKQTTDREREKVQSKNFLLQLPPTILQENFDEEDVAVAITTYEHTQFSSLSVNELFCWSQGKKKNCDCIHSIVNFSNKLANWVTSTIVKQIRKQNRVVLLEKFVILAENLLDLKNFSSCCAVIGGLTNSAIWRMKKTWALVDEDVQRRLTKIKQIMSPTDNYSKYRAYIEDSAPPCMPYLGVYLSDLTFIHDGNKNHEVDEINFSKCKIIAKELRSFIDFQNTYYDVQECQSNFQKAMDDIEIFTDSQLFDYSNLAEPKDQEKAMENLLNQCKNLEEQLKEANNKINQFENSEKETKKK